MARRNGPAPLEQTAMLTDLTGQTLGARRTGAGAATLSISSLLSSLPPGTARPAASVRCAKTPSLLLLRCRGIVPPRRFRLRLAALPAPARTRGHTRRARDARAMAGAATFQEGGVPSCTTTR